MRSRRRGIKSRSRFVVPRALALLICKKVLNFRDSCQVYKQKVKHLLYEYQNNIAHLQTDSERALQLDQEEHMQSEHHLKRDKRALKLELKEFELAHEDIIKNLKQKHDQEITKMRVDFERRGKELHSKYEKKMKIIRDDLELKRKNEIHEIEERKNGQINALMKNHDKAFTEIKNYYNDITLNNLALINSLKVRSYTIADRVDY